MKTHTPDAQTMVVSSLEELTAANAAQLRENVRAALPPACTCLDLDLSQTTFLDSSGLGALIALHKTMLSRQGRTRILNPTPTVLQILELTRLHRVFEIVQP